MVNEHSTPSRALQGEVVVITGAARGLGSAYARECARQGAAVLASDLDEEPLDDVIRHIAARGGLIRGIAADVTDLDQMHDLAASAVEKWGRVTGWINNAGLQVLHHVDEVAPQHIEAMVGVNVVGAIYGTAAAARVMKQQGFGSIVNVTSGAHQGIEFLTAYGATKGAAASLTYSAAIELRPFGVRVNAVSPLAATQMTEDGDEFLTEQSGETVDATTHLRPPEACAGLPAFLVSTAATDVTGQVIRFDGTTLALLDRPAVLPDTKRTVSSWDVDDFVRIFRTELADELVEPVFVSPVRDNR